jgi:hypothetical protein
MEKKLSDRLQDAYMLGNQELIGQLKQEVQDKAAGLQKKIAVTPLMVNTVFNNDNSSAIKIYEFLNSTFGEDWWELEFETIERLLWIKYGVALDDANRDKIFGLKHLCNSNRPWLDFYEFDIVALSTNGFIADFEILRMPTRATILSTIKTMNYLRPEEPFSREIKKFISIVFIMDGCIIPPLEILDLVGDEFETLISKENRLLWPDIYKRYEEVIKSKNFNLSEELIDIQVLRLMNSEKASLEYSK